MTFETVRGGDSLSAEPDGSSIYVDELDFAEAHDQWGVVTRELQDAGTLALSNGHAIKRLVDFACSMNASKHVSEHGPVLKGKRAKVGQWNRIGR